MSQLKAIRSERDALVPRLNQLTEDAGRRRLSHAERDEWARLHLRHKELVRRMRAIKGGDEANEYRDEPAQVPQEPGPGQ